MESGDQEERSGTFEIRRKGSWVCVRQNGPKDIHFLIPGTRQWVMLLGKRDFAGVVKVIGLKIWRVT